MNAAKLIPIIIGVVLVLTVGLFIFVPGMRPAIVDKWFRQAKGLGPATSPEDALDKFKRALEKRDYDAAKHYLTGDYAVTDVFIRRDDRWRASWRISVRLA